MDLRPRSRGALHFANWLAATKRAGEEEQFVGVHVLEGEHLRYELRLHHLDEVIGSARRSARDVLEVEGVARLIREVEVLQGLYADEGLEAAREHHAAESIIVGRAARRGTRPLVRLGPVARRMLRRLRSPVVIVPPDVREQDIGPGPIVALTSLEEDSAEACRLAERLAKELGRRFVVVQVLTATSPSLSPAAWREREAALERWIEAGGLRPEASALLEGPTVERALEFATRCGAPLLVVGAHHQSALRRLFTRSTASALAGRGPLPVAVVPPRTWNGD